MALGIFVIRDGAESVDDVQAIRAQAIALAKQGIAVMEWSGGGTSTTSRFVMDIKTVLEETKYALQLAGVFPQRITRTRPGFNTFY